MGRSKFRISEFSLLVFPPLFWLVLFFVVPLIIVLVYSVSQRGAYGGVTAGFTFEHYRMALDPLYLKIFLRSLLYACLTTTLTLAAAYPVAYFMAFASNRVKLILLFLVVLPFWTNFLIRMYSFIILFGESGLVNKALLGLGLIRAPVGLLHTPFAVMAGLVYWSLPYMIIPIFSALDRMDMSLIESSMDLGASRAATFRNIALPWSLPGIVAGVVFVFVPTLGNFIVPDLLGGTDSYMIGNVITSQFQQGHNWPFGSALSWVLIFVVMVFIAVYIRFYDPARSRKLMER